MRPDPSDIIIKRRLQHSRNKTDYRNILTTVLPTVIRIESFTIKLQLPLSESLISLNFNPEGLRILLKASNCSIIRS